MIDENKLIDKLKKMESVVDNYSSDVRQTCLNLICEIKDFIYEQLPEPYIGRRRINENIEFNFCYKEKNII